MRDDPGRRDGTDRTMLVEATGLRLVLTYDAPPFRSVRRVDRLAPYDLAARVLDACPMRSGVGPERLASVAGCDVLEVLRVLPALEPADLVQWTVTGWRLAPPPRRSDGSGAA